MSECPHAYWHESQCPYCALEATRQELRLVRLQRDSLQLAYDKAASEAAVFRLRQNAYQRVLRQRRKK